MPRKVDNPRDYTITLRINAEERERLRDDRKGMTLSEYLRYRLFGHGD